MGFEIPLDCDYTEHPKALKMIALLGKNADIFPIRLWCWCAKFAKKGVIDGGPSQIEEACKWHGPSGKLHAALIEAKVLEKDGKTVHDWMEHAGRAIAKYEKKKKNQRAKYAAETLEESRHAAPDSAEFFRKNSGIPPPCNRREEKTTEENRTEQPENGADELTELAQEFAFMRGEGTSPREIARVRVHLVDLAENGFTVDEIRTEMRSKRLNSEPVWDFQKRLLDLKNVKKPNKTGKSVSSEGFAAFVENARARTGGS